MSKRKKKMYCVHCVPFYELSKWLRLYRTPSVAVCCYYSALFTQLSNRLKVDLNTMTPAIDDEFQKKKDFFKGIWH